MSPESLAPHLREIHPDDLDCPVCGGRGYVETIDQSRVRPDSLTPPYRKADCPECDGGGTRLPECSYCDEEACLVLIEPGRDDRLVCRECAPDELEAAIRRYAGPRTVEHVRVLAFASPAPPGTVCDSTACAAPALVLLTPDDDESRRLCRAHFAEWARCIAAGPGEAPE